MASDSYRPGFEPQVGRGVRPWVGHRGTAAGGATVRPSPTGPPPDPRRPHDPRPIQRHRQGRHGHRGRTGHRGRLRAGPGRGRAPTCSSRPGPRTAARRSRPRSRRSAGGRWSWPADLNDLDAVAALAAGGLRRLRTHRHRGQQRRRDHAPGFPRDLPAISRAGLPLQRGDRPRARPGVGPPMLEGGGGAIVNISSVMGRMPDGVSSPTARPRRPWPTTPGWRRPTCPPHPSQRHRRGLDRHFGPRHRPPDDELRTTMEAMTPLGRLGEPEDIAAASSSCPHRPGSFVTGKVIEGDGGLDHPISI